MTRGLSASMLTEIQKPTVRMAHLLKIQTSTPILLTNHYRNLAFNSENYLANGDLLNVPIIRENLNIKSNIVSFVLTSANQSYLSQFLTENPTNSKVTLWIAFIDSTSTIVADPIEIFAGYVDDWECKEDSTSQRSSISVNAASIWVDFEKVAGRKTNSSSQNIYFPTDSGFEFSSQIVKDLKWGKT